MPLEICWQKNGQMLVGFESVTLHGNESISQLGKRISSSTQKYLWHLTLVKGKNQRQIGKVLQLISCCICEIHQVSFRGRFGLPLLAKFVQYVAIVSAKGLSSCNYRGPLFHNPMDGDPMASGNKQLTKYQAETHSCVCECPTVGTSNCHSG